MTPSRSRVSLWILVGIYGIVIGVGLSTSGGAPPEETQGEAARLLLVHVPSVISAYAALVVGLVAALWYLARRSPGADLLSASAVEIGGLFIGLTLVSGMIWGRIVWGLWWDWRDARMMSTAVLFFIIVGYLAMRRSIDDQRVRAVRSAVLSTIAAVQIPIVHYSVLWFRTLHQGPSILRPDAASSTMDASYARPLGYTILMFLVFSTVLLFVRLDLARLEARTADLSMSGAPVGGAVRSPLLGGRDG